MRPILLLLLFLGTSFYCSSQDYIYKIDGTVEEGKVIEVTIDVIKYYQWDLPKGPVFEMLKTDIHKIKFKNGVEQVYNERLTRNQKATALGLDSLKPYLLIGDHYQGGIIFYLDSTMQHGIIAAPADQIERTCWGNIGKTNATDMNEGAFNTKEIISFMKKKRTWECPLPAACICDTLNLNGFTDWYLPSINELKGMYANQKVIGNFTTGDYCSSTERNGTTCWNIHFQVSKHRKTTFNDHKIIMHYHVRCIRKF
ncbi:hypothetical protein ACFLS7_06830 [Bacteroidota bacterium]